MSNKYFQNRYRIPSVRAAWHNYNGGLYFVTICTHNRKHYFGKILADSTLGKPQMVLSPIGQFADEQFRNAHAHSPYAEIPLWVVMPNHIHAIVGIDHNKIPYERRNMNLNNTVAGPRCAEIVGGIVGGIVEPRCTTALQQEIVNTTEFHKQIANMQGWLSVTVGGLKRAITCFAHQNHLPFAWQTRFHDHIIRDTDELNRIANYIRHNVETGTRFGKNCGNNVR